MNAFWMALQFLTVVRVPQPLHCMQEDFRKALIFFPLVGLLLGLLLASLAWAGLQLHLHRELLAILLVIAGLIFTGGLHLDGVADTADGFGAGNNRESALRIMKDRRTGVFGVAAIMLCLYLKIVAFRIILRPVHFQAMILAPMLSRVFLTASCTLLPYARAQGTGALFSGFSFCRSSLPVLLPAFALSIVLDRVHAPNILSWLCLIWLVWSALCFYKIRGYTGDTLGCQNELLEISAMLLAGQLS